MIDASADNLGEFANLLRSVLGEDRFQRMLGKYEPSSSMSEQSVREASAHPFAVAWHELSRGVEESKNAGEFRLSEQAFFLLDLLSSLICVSERSHIPEELLDRLIGKKQFHSTSFEAFIFSAYAEGMGANIEQVSDRQQGSGRVPDFKLMFGTQAVYAECKSLEDETLKESRAWSMLEIRAAKALRAQKDSWKVDILAEAVISHDDVDEIITSISDTIANYDLVRGASTTSARVRVQRIMEHGQRAPMPIELPHDEDDRLWMEASVIAEVNAAEHVFAVRSTPYKDVDQTDRIINLIEKSLGQFPRDEASVLHIQVPYRHAAHFLDIADRSYNDIARYLSTHARRISAVVLTGRFLNKKMTNETGPIITHHAIIPNYACERELPREFHILGSANGSASLKRASEAIAWEDGKPSPLVTDEFTLEREGTLVMEFEIWEPLNQQAGRYQFRHVSHDGKSQITIWQSYKNDFRVEIFHPDFGRRIFTCDLNHMPVGTVQRMAVAWCADEIRCAYNGQMLQNMAA